MVWGVTRALLASSADDAPGACSSALRVEYWGMVRPELSHRAFEVLTPRKFGLAKLVAELSLDAHEAMVNSLPDISQADMIAACLISRDTGGAARRPMGHIVGLARST